ncbi:hypothetical protein AMS58_06875 [Pseudoalteromonas porphyrae]|uniref:pyrimidine/purine nucleoside phosphorylase n=1 Tax=Pseudoalteromonas porphyrae TaxID=187330 RepID=UPI0006BABEF3|nr:pyrimidine/purine nucleoside phosphorylase [Pseudoalteromonas porphyrae]KPH95441.1 hypothetical protein AMS58_06875 [Pseudoalteromonas porphyrae]
MSQFDNVSVIKKANVYFDGKVSSRTVVFADGSTKTLGFMQAGEFEFATSKKELMELNGGQWSVLLLGESEWQTMQAGESFNVDADVTFQVKVTDFADYCCSYT